MCGTIYQTLRHPFRTSWMNLSHPKKQMGITNQNHQHLPLARACSITSKVYGDPDRLPELAELNGITRDNPYRACG